MTKLGGVSYRRRAAMLLAPVIMLAFTFLVPLTTFAETENDQQPPSQEAQDPTFAPELVQKDQNVYRERADKIELRTAKTIQKDEVVFVVGEERIPAVEDVAASKDQYISWHPAYNPATGIKLTVEVQGVPVDGQSVSLHEKLSFAIDQSSDMLVVKSSAGTVLSGTKVEVAFNDKAPIVPDCTGGCGVNTELARFPLDGLIPGDYTIELSLTDDLGTFPSESKKITIPASTDSEPPTDPGTPPVIPVTPSPDIYIPKIDVVPIELLSTNFSIPVAANIVATTKRSSIFQATAAPPNGEVQGVATEERATVENVVDLTADEQPVVPLAPTSGGWSLFGVSWYWWAGSIAATWVAGMSLRLWLRKP